jgi:hypothetical protein
MSLRGFLSLPVLVVAVLALALGSALGSVGTAVAGPALTKGKVRSIAAKVVKKTAPSLSVAHATTADNATDLAGRPATTYLDRVVQATSTTGVAVPIGDNTQILGPVAITVPPGVGFVQVSAVAVFATGNTPFVVWSQTDGPCVDTGIDYAHRQFGHTANQISVSLNRVVPVTAGTHEFRLCVGTSEAINTDNRVLTVETVALGS